MDVAAWLQSLGLKHQPGRVLLGLPGAGLTDSLDEPAQDHLPQEEAGGDGRQVEEAGDIGLGEFDSAPAAVAQELAHPDEWHPVDGFIQIEFH